MILTVAACHPVSVSTAIDIAVSRQVLHRHGEYHLIRLFILLNEEVSITSFEKSKSALAHFEEVSLGLVPLLQPHVDFSAESVYSAFGDASEVAVARSIFGRKMLTVNDIRQIVQNNVPDLFFRFAASGILAGSQILQIDRNAMPKGIEPVIGISTDEFAFRYPLRFKFVRQCCRPSDIGNDIISPVHAFVQILPIVQEHPCIGLHQSQQKRITEGNIIVVDIEHRRERVPVRAAVITVIVRQKAAIDARYRIFRQCGRLVHRIRSDGIIRIPVQKVIAAYRHGRRGNRYGNFYYIVHNHQFRTLD